MMDAQLAIYCGIGDKANPHSYSKVKSRIHYKKDVSSRDVISTQLMWTDPYEEKRVYVKESLILDANEGLFASIDAGKNVDSRDWKYNDNTISLDQEIVIDVPAEFSSTTSYKASLGHKANHSFTPNCKYDRFDNHPRFGRIKCIRTIQPVRAGDELTVAYGYDHNKLETDAPEWYKEKLKQFQKLFRRMQPF
ncbi:histone-lysine N-methyltransferase SETD7-like [Clytia hemisphaerica]|uniref:SET domain-containing protein n=1 Tax=Clytia hemisphaerica TaxID=252671 RepID=A0A7M5V8R3_9CNID